MSYNKVFILILAPCLIFIASIRPYDLNFDTSVYYSIAKDFINGVNYVDYMRSIEPSYWLISIFAKYINIALNVDPVRVVFFIYALLGVGLSIYAILNFSSFPVLSFLIYLPMYLSFEFTAIRNAVGLGILLMALNDIKNRKMFSYMVKVTIGFLFHYSLIIFYAFYFFVNTDKAKREREKYLTFIIFSFILYFINFNKLLLQLSEQFSEYPIFYKLYIYLQEENIEFRAFSITKLIIIALLTFLIINLHKIKNDYVVLTVKTSIWITLFVYLFNNYVISGRLWNYVLFFSIFYVAYLPKLFKQKIILYLIVFIYSLFGFYAQIFLLRPPITTWNWSSFLSLFY